MKPNKSLAIAYAVKSKNAKKKMAEGGGVEDRDKMSGKSGMIRTDTEANQNQKGVHQHGSKGSSGGISEAGGITRDYGSKGEKAKGSYGKEKASHVKPEHKRVLEELKAMPKPKLPMAEGGLVDEEHLMDLYPQDETEHFDSITDAIRHKMNLKKMAEGGMVDIEKNNEEQPNAYYDADEDALKENYDQDFEDMSQPHDSNLKDDEIDSDKHDMISAIRHKMKKMR